MLLLLLLLLLPLRLSSVGRHAPDIGPVNCEWVDNLSLRVGRWVSSYVGWQLGLSLWLLCGGRLWRACPSCTSTRRGRAGRGGSGSGSGSCKEV